MPADSVSLQDHFLPEEPLHPEGAAFFAQVTGMLDGQPKEPVAVEAALIRWDGVLETMAGDLYRISSMLVGEGEEAVGMIEQVVSSVDLTLCADHFDARHRGRLVLAAKAINILHQRDAASLAARADESADSGPVTCIEDDDLSAAGLSPIEFEQLITGPDRHRLRDWLESLPASLRVIFVLRAVAALTSSEVAGLLDGNTSLDATSSSPAWTTDAVRTAFRQALCSLASQLIHASTAR